MDWQNRPTYQTGRGVPDDSRVGDGSAIYAGAVSDRRPAGIDYGVAAASRSVKTNMRLTRSSLNVYRWNTVDGDTRGSPWWSRIRCVDDGNQVAANGEEVGWNHCGICDSKLDFPVGTDRRFTFEDGSVRYVRPLNVVGHHGQQLVDPSIVEAGVSALEKDNPLGAVHVFSLTLRTVRRTLGSGSV